MTSRCSLFLLSLTLVGGCADSLEGLPCEGIGTTACDGLALFRCNGETWLKQGDCSWACQDETAAPKVHDELAGAEVWTCEEGPHVVRGVLMVPEGHTLTVAPGAEVRIERGGRIDTTATSAVVAEGTEGTPILITSADGTGDGYGAANQGGLNLFAQPADADVSSLRHVIVERGQHGVSVLGLSEDNEAPAIEACTFRDNAGWGVLVRGCEGEMQRPAYDLEGDNLFFENGEGAVSPCQ